MRGGMAAAARARGWVPPPVPPSLLLLQLLLPAVCTAAREPPAAAGLSLHPPYFNLAQAARIWATATCGEPESGGAQPRPELYCKLVGGPTAPGRGHTIQVRSGVRAGGGGELGRAPSPRGSATRGEGIGPFPRALVTPDEWEGLPQLPRGPATPRGGRGVPRAIPWEHRPCQRAARGGDG